MQGEVINFQKVSLLKYQVAKMLTYLSNYKKALVDSFGMLTFKKVTIASSIKLYR